MGALSQAGSGDARRALLFVSADGHVWSLRWESWVQRGRGAAFTCVSHEQSILVE